MPVTTRARYFATVWPSHAGARAAAMLCLLAALGGCVTETTGGFNVERSDAQALENYIQLAVGYLEENDLVNAKRHLNNAGALDGNNSEVLAIWGLVYSREGEEDLADQNFRRSLRIDPENSQARNNYAAFLFANARYQEAFEQLQQVVTDTDYPGRAQAFENLGLAALRVQRLSDAELAFSRALQLNANQLRSILELASLSLQKPDVAQARSHYRNYLTLMQFYNIPHSARSLWVGVQLENALGNASPMREYGKLLETNFSATAEYQSYLQLLDTLEDE